VTFARSDAAVDTNERASSAEIADVPAPINAVDSDGAIAFESEVAAVIVIAAGVDVDDFNTPLS
jgi:hypothetical protein